MSNNQPLIKITIDNRVVEVKKGSTILQAAEKNGFYIPTLCAHKDLTPYGGCRMCVVEVDGVRGLPTACTTPAEDGMIIRTDTAQVQELRREVLQLILTEHPHNCLFCEEVDDCLPYMYTVRKGDVVTGCNSCPQNDRCELQTLVRRLDVKRIDLPFKYHNFPVEKYDPFFDRDYNLCILCGRCIRECQEVRGANVLTFKQRGSKTIVGPAYERTHMEAGCEFCGACVAVCPTGTLSEKTSKWMGKPDHEVITTCAFCGIGCQIHLQIKNKEVMSSLPSSDSIVESQLCVKGRFGVFETVNNPYRLFEPYHTQNGYKVKVSWDEAAELAAAQLKECPPGQFSMTVSPDCTNEDLYIAQKFTRQVMHSNQIENNSRPLYGTGFNPYLDLLRMASPLSELAAADVVLSIGLDTRYSRSVVGVELRKAMHKGARLFTIHPRDHNLAIIANRWLQIQCGHTVHAFTVLANLTGASSGETHQSPEIIEIATALKNSSHPVFLIGSEFVQYRTCKELIELLEIMVQNTGARVIPLIGQSNLMGTLLMGACAGLSPGGFPVPHDFSNDESKRTVQPKVHFHIGSLPTIGQPQAEFEIFQNFCLPENNLHADLILPTAAFTEVNGSLVSEDGTIRRFNQAVKPPGMALPHWQALCLIARKMGAKGFDFNNIEEINAEMRQAVPGWNESISTGTPIRLPQECRLPEDIDQPECTPRISSEYPYILHAAISEETYQGFPLTRLVKGLQYLLAEEKLFIHPEDAKNLGVLEGETIVVTSTSMEKEWPVQIEKDQVRGTVSIVLRQGDLKVPMMEAVSLRRNHV